MPLPQGRFSTACLLLTVTLLSLVVSSSAQAGSTCIQPAPRSPLEASLPSVVNPEPAASWGQLTQQESVASAPSSFASKATKGGAGGSRTGKAFTPAGKKKIDAENAAKNDGTNKCENCGIEVVPGQKSQSGVSPPTNQRERDHVIPKSKGGEGTPENGQVLCRECNLEKSNKAP